MGTKGELPGLPEKYAQTSTDGTPADKVPSPSRRKLLKTAAVFGGSLVLFPLLAACQRPEESQGPGARTLPSTKSGGPDLAPTAKAAPTAQPKPPEAPKPAASEGKISLSKKPEELFRALLVEPYLPNELPPGFTVKGMSAANLNPTARALQAIGEVNVLFLDNDDPGFSTPKGGISYVIFPDVSRAKDGYNNLLPTANANNVMTAEYLAEYFKSFERFDVKSLNSPPVLFAQPAFGGSISMCALQFENVLVTSSFSNIGEGYDVRRVVRLSVAAIGHLQRVGR